MAECRHCGAELDEAGRDVNGGPDGDDAVTCSMRPRPNYGPHEPISDETPSGYYSAEWNGGHSYRPSGPDDREGITSLAAARWLLRARYDNVGRYTPGMLETPAVDETSEILLYAPGVDYYGRVSDVPLYRVYFGPRMGVRVEKL